LSELSFNITSPAADQLYIDILSGLNECLDIVRAKPHEHRGTTGLIPYERQQPGYRLDYPIVPFSYRRL